MSVEYLGLRWGFAQLPCNSKKTTKEEQHFSADGEISTEEIILLHEHDWTCQLTLRFRFLLGAASIATVVNLNLPGSKDCLRWRYSSVEQPKRVAEKTKALAGPCIIRTQWSQSKGSNVTLMKVKGEKKYLNLSNS